MPPKQAGIFPKQLQGFTNPQNVWTCQNHVLKHDYLEGWGISATSPFKVPTSASRIAPPNNSNAVLKTALPPRIWGTQSNIKTNPLPSAKSRLAQHDETSPGFQCIEISAATWARFIPYECLADMAEVSRLYCFLKKKRDLWVLL